MSMKGIHTADWHLGKVVHGQSFLQEQREQIQRITQLIREESVDFVMISGDLFDRAIPPVEALVLWESVLEEWVEELGIQVFVIAGNHDSAVRLSFANRFLEKQRVSILGDFSRFFTPLEVIHDKERIQVYFLPYLDTAYLREILERPEERSREVLLRSAVERIQQTWDPKAFHLLLAHEFLLGGSVSDSERPLSVGGSQAIPYQVFENFDYVALGHLHRAQRIGKDHIRYAGALYPYSFSEAGRVPSVELLYFGEDGSFEREKIEIKPERTLRVVEGRLDEVLALPSSEDYLCVRIENKEVILDLMGKLREWFPNTLRVERGQTGEVKRKEEEDILAREAETPLELFTSFFTEMTGDELLATQTAYLHGMLDRREGEDKA
jgi:exonuclease SbcD